MQAFLLPLLRNIIRRARGSGGGSGSNVPQLLVVAPSRELALQIAGECERFAPRIVTVALIGGVNVARQLDRLKRRKPHVLVGTPGRLAELAIDHAGRRLQLNDVRTVVVDEVDRCMDGDAFHADLARLLDRVRSATLWRARGEPRPREAALQLLFASATGNAPAVLRAAARQMPVRPFLLSVSSRREAGDGLGLSMPPNLRHYFAVAPARLRLDAVRKLTYAATRALSEEDERGSTRARRQRAPLEVPNTHVVPTIVFVPDQRSAEVYAERLDARGVYAAALTGGSARNPTATNGGGGGDSQKAGKSKFDRASVMQGFRRGAIRVLVTTELAARGLDFPRVGLVVNAGGMPTDASHYVHRAGRTGRMGRRGIVVSVVNGHEAFVVRKFSRALGVAIDECEVQHGELVSVDSR